MINALRPKIECPQTKCLEPISSKEWLEVKFCYLASGDSFMNLSYLFKYNNIIVIYYNQSVKH